MAGFTKDNNLVLTPETPGYGAALKAVQAIYQSLSDKVGNVRAIAEVPKQKIQQS